MKKKIIIGSLLAVFIMMMLPSASAVESSTIEETLKSQQPIVNPDIDIGELKLKYQDDPAEPKFVILFLLSILLNILRAAKFATIFAILLIFIIRRITNSSAV